MTVVTFACEFEVQDSSAASRQVTMDLCSAQHQRRALGFDDGLLFGATLVGSTLSMFVSEWLEDKVVSPQDPPLLYYSYAMKRWSVLQERHLN